MNGPLDEAESATPLTPEEREGLIPSHITLRSELNELEQQNILEAATWASLRRRDPVGEPFARSLHRRMFRDVWSWAGAYRTSDKNLGVKWPLIQPGIHEVLEQTRYWIDNKCNDSTRSFDNRRGQQSPPTGSSHSSFNPSLATIGPHLSCSASCGGRDPPACRRVAGRRGGRAARPWQATSARRWSPG